MLTAKMLSTYKDLKSKMDAAYEVAKKDPSYNSISKHTIASQTFTTFCINAMAELAGEESKDYKDQILANIEEYKTCKKCNSEILFQTDESKYIGWCHTCLAEHCLRTNCEECSVASDPTTCSFKDIKVSYQED